MRVFEDSVPATCAIMSEEKGLNGTASESCSKISVKSEPNPSSDCNDTFSYGGRLKFFKDGKFILELSHRKDGEKMSWTPVPKKTYWPPSVTSVSTTNSVRQESTTSLSVSDDNSSVQSSPWQRDHCWKQNSPRKAASAEMTFVMVPLPRAFHARKLHGKVLNKKRRRPYDQIENLDVKDMVNGTQRPLKSKSSAIKNGELNSLIQRLWDNVKISDNVVQTVQKSSGNIFSPRKRILRELEKVSLTANIPEDQTQQNMKRQRSKTSTNGTRMCPPSNKVSSYSIVSLLGNKEESDTVESEPSFLRNLLRSPSREMSPEPSPKARKNSSPAHNKSFSPSPESVRSTYGAPGSSVHPSFPFMHAPMTYPPFYSHQSSSVASPSSYYSSMSSPYRGSPHGVWLQYPMSSLPRSGTYPGLLPATTAYHTHPFPYHWGPAHSSSVEVKKEEGNSDVPLNLSKHPG